MNWAGISVAVGIVALCIATAPWGLLVLLVLWLWFSGKFNKR